MWKSSYKTVKCFMCGVCFDLNQSLNLQCMYYFQHYSLDIVQELNKRSRRKLQFKKNTCITFIQVTILYLPIVQLSCIFSDLNILKLSSLFSFGLLIKQEQASLVHFCHFNYSIYILPLLFCVSRSMSFYQTIYNLIDSGYLKNMQFISSNRL